VAGLRDYGGKGCILADDMGLGKTLQGITLLWTLLKQGFDGQPMGKRILIVCPTSLVSNWDQECDKVRAVVPRRRSRFSLKSVCASGTYAETDAYDRSCCVLALAWFALPPLGASLHGSASDDVEVVMGAMCGWGRVLRCARVQFLKGRVRTVALSESSRADVIASMNTFLRPNSIFQVMIVSYETFRIHADKFAKEGSCDLLICDEAHRLKNADTLTNKVYSPSPPTRKPFSLACSVALICGRFPPSPCLHTGAGQAALQAPRASVRNATAERSRCVPRIPHHVAPEAEHC